MKYRQIGDLRVSVLGLGGNVFGHFCDENETKAIIDAAFELGINFIDTANVYSDGLSESYIGKAIAGRREKFIIATKAGIHSNQEPKNWFTREYILKSVEESLNRLGTTYIDLYQVHLYDTTVPLKETIDALMELKKEGKVRHLGCSNYTLVQLREAVKLGAEFETVQLSYNVLERDIEKEIVPFCKEHGITVLPYRALGRGLLSGKYDSPNNYPAGSRAEVSRLVREDITPETIEKIRGIQAFATKYHRTSIEYAIAWLLQRPCVSSVLIGVRSVKQLKGCASAVDWVDVPDFEVR